MIGAEPPADVVTEYAAKFELKPVWSSNHIRSFAQRPITFSYSLDVQSHSFIRSTSVLTEVYTRGV